MIGLKVEREVTETIPINVMSDLATMVDFHGEPITSLFSVFTNEFQA